MIQKEKIKELLKCKQDPIYFINNYVARDEVGGKTLFKTYPKQDEYVKTFLDKHYVIVLKSRQIGISTITRAICAWAVTFYSNVTIGVISRQGSESTDFARKTRDMIESLPKWMRPKFIKKTEQSFILENNSELVASQVNQGNPTSVFRGKTLTILVIDEAAFISKIDQAYTGIAPATLRAHQVASQKNIPYGIMIISTPNGTVGIGKWYYDMWREAVTGKSNFVPVKIHYSDAPFVNEKWIQEMKKIITRELDWQQEMELKFVTGQDSLFNYEISIQLQENSYKPKEKIQREYFNNRRQKVGSGEWNFYYDDNLIKAPAKFYVAGIDIAAGHIGNCNSAIQIIDADTLEQVAEFDGKLRVTDLKNEILWLIKEKFNENILIVPEMNSIGIKLVEELDEEIHDYLYYTKYYNKNGMVTKVVPGFVTSAKTRPQIIDALYWTIREDPKRIKSNKLITQLLSLDKYLRGGLSDLAIAYGIATHVVRNENIDSYRSLNFDYETKEMLDSLFYSDYNQHKNSNSKIKFRIGRENG